MDRHVDIALELLVDRGNYKKVTEVVTEHNLGPEEQTAYIGRAKIQRFLSVHPDNFGYLFLHERQAAAKKHTIAILTDISQDEKFYDYLGRLATTEDKIRFINRLGHFSAQFETQGVVGLIVDLLKSPKTRTALRGIEEDRDNEESSGLSRKLLTEVVEGSFHTISLFPFYPDSFFTNPIPADIVERTQNDLKAMQSTWSGLIDSQRVVKTVLGNYQNGRRNSIVDLESAKPGVYAVLDFLIEISDKATVSGQVCEQWISKIEDPETAKNTHKILTSEGKIDHVPIEYTDCRFYKRLKRYETDHISGNIPYQELLRAICTQSQREVVAEKMVGWFFDGKDSLANKHNPDGFYCLETAKRLFTDRIAEASESNQRDRLSKAMNLPASVINLDDPRISGFATAYRAMQDQGNT